MREYYFPEAVVLTKDGTGEADLRVNLYAKDFGKIGARVKSARKILSKLGPHLEPGSLVRVRMIEKTGPQIVDVLKNRCLPISFFDLALLEQLLPEEDFDEEVWNLLIEDGGVSNNFDSGLFWTKTLKVLGWDPVGSTCNYCELNRPNRFTISSQRFLCENCSAQFELDNLNNAFRRTTNDLIVFR